MNINFYKKIIIGSILCGLIFNPSVFSLKTERVMAGILDIEGGSIVDYLDPSMLTGTGALAVTPSGLLVDDKGKKIQDQAKWYKDLWIAIKKALIETAGQKLKKMILDRIMDQTIEWIKTGGKGGSPPFITDFGGFLEKAADDWAGTVIQESMPAFCTPFQVNMAIGFGSEPQKFSKEIECTLSEVVDNVEDAIENFDKKNIGKWVTYNALWEPQNNFFGSSLAMRDELERGTKSILEQKNLEATVNLGFKSQTVCKPDPETGKPVCEVLTPGQVLAGATTKAVERKTDAVLTSNDMALYLGALADAALFRLGVLANDGLVGWLGTSEEDIPDNALGWTKWQKDRFSLINQITLDNTKAMYLDTINSVLTVKTNTVNIINQSIGILSVLYNELATLEGCSADSGLTPEQSTALNPGNLGDKLETISDVINNDLAPTVISLDDNILDLESVKASFDNLDEDNQETMFMNYSHLESSGVLDLESANEALNEAQVGLTDVQNYSDELLLLDSTLGGYKDVFELLNSGELSCPTDEETND
ncbi:hypothetical protein KJ671_01240 [Patescibacteria group bacterium]|nr:hypothetical protein [Patescibacteria group bacterium]